MSKENNIRKGLLSEKMRNFHAEPPADAWDNIASQLPRDGSRKVFLIVLTAAAGLALAITVGIKLVDRSPETPMAENMAQDTAPGQDPVNKDQTLPETQATKLEEKVQLAMEEVIREMEDKAVKLDQPDKVILAENVEATQEIIEETQEDIEETQEDIEETQEDIEETQEEGVVEDQTENAAVDSAYSERYIDSLSKAAIPEDDIIPDDKKEQRKWQLGASLTPLFSYRDASSSDQVQNMAANNSESGVLAYSGGVQVRYAQSNRLTFESGIYYNKMGVAIGNFETYRSRQDYVFANETFTDNSIVSMSNSIGTIASARSADVVVNSFSGSAPESIYSTLDSKEMTVADEVVSSLVQSLGYLEIPFNVKYKVVDRDLKVLLIGGFSTNLLVGNQVLANTAGGQMNYGRVGDIRTINLSGNAGLGFVYEFPGNFSLSLEPRFKYYLNSVNTEYLPVTRPFALGLYTGVNYTF